jgi:hypothetical protein
MTVCLSALYATHPPILRERKADDMDEQEHGILLDELLVVPSTPD